MPNLHPCPPRRRRRASRHGAFTMSLPSWLPLTARVAEVVRVGRSRRSAGRRSACRRRAPGFGAAPGTDDRRAEQSAVRSEEKAPRAVVRWRVMAPVRARRAGPTTGSAGASERDVIPRSTPWGRTAPRGVDVAEPSRMPRVASLESAPMKIAVCVKQVPDAAAHKRIDPATKRLDRSGEGALNPFDANAVEEALRLKDAPASGEVVVVSMGPEQALGLAAQGARDGRRPRRARLRRRRAPAPTSSRRATRSRRRSSARSADLVLFGQQSATPTAPCSGPRSPTGCACRSSRRSPSSTLDGGTVDAASGRPSSATT